MRQRLSGGGRMTSAAENSRRSVGRSVAVVSRRRPEIPRAVILADGGVAVQGGAKLSRAHLEILECIAAGFTNAEIAADRGISTETVKKHAHKLMRLIGARNRASLAAWWTEVADSLARSIHSSE
jgi:DNA-binding NarL/FixJ family response regulator